MSAPGPELPVFGGATALGDRPAWVETCLLGVVMLAVYGICAAVAGPYVLDSDVVNLALAIERFDVPQHQPHPPGYLGYVLVLRAVHAVTRAPALEVTRMVSRLFITATLPMVWAAARALSPGSRRGAMGAVAIAATNPVLLYYGIDGQTHSGEAALSAGLLWALAGARRDPTVRRGALVGALMAAGGSLRPSFALIAGLPVLWAFGRRWRPLAAAAAVAAVGTLAWLAPTVASCGGWAGYKVAGDALIVDAYVRTTSLLSPRRVRGYVDNNLRNVAVWSVVALGAPVLALAARLAARAEWKPPVRHAALLLALMATPAVSFYVLVFCAEPGYFAGLVAPAALATALACSAGVARGRWLPAVGLALAVAQAGVFALGPARVLERRALLPSLQEIANRHARSAILIGWIEQGVRPDESVLVVTDYSNNTVLRQLPLVRPRTDTLFLHSARYEIFATTTISLARAHSWRASGPALLSPGPPATLVSPERYDWVVLDPRSSDVFWAEIRAQSRCPLPPTGAFYGAPHLRTRDCFPAGVIRFPPHALRFGVP